MKPWLVKSINLCSCIIIFIFISYLTIPSLLHASGTQSIGEDKIKIENGKVWGQLKGLARQDVLRILAQKAGIEIVGLKNVTGIIQDLKFNDVSIENAISKIAQDSVVISHKEGIKGSDFSIKKIIILPDTPEDKQRTIPRIEISSEKTPPPQTPPPEVQPPQTPPPPQKQLPEAKTPLILPPQTPPPQTPPPEVQPPQTPPPPQKQIPEVKTPLILPPQTPPPQTPPPTVEPPKTAPPKVAGPKENKNKEQGLAYFKKKRWDLAVKNFEKYLKINPSDKEIQKKIDEANEYIKKAIKFYNAGRIEQEKWNLEGAYINYKKAYELYPLLYDCWERMQSVKNGL